MKPIDAVKLAFALRDVGWTRAEIAAETGVATSTLSKWWRADPDALLKRRTNECPDRCPLRADVAPDAYAYLLGQYLGDGWINMKARRGVHRLTITCCSDYPGIIDECQRAIEAVLPANRVGRVVRRGVGVTIVQSHSKHWPCLVPQCGVGPKHARRIELESWQEQIALVERPQQFLRGLVHSDGCRAINRVRNATGKKYEYPRYQFTNHSADIRDLFARACVAVGVECKRMNRYNLSVNKRADVAALDTFIGPKS